MLLCVFIVPLFSGDLFDMLLPMLCIYQEYVRNHHYSLQVGECVVAYFNLRTYPTILANEMAGLPLLTATIIHYKKGLSGGRMMCWQKFFIPPYCLYMSL